MASTGSSQASQVSEASGSSQCNCMSCTFRSVIASSLFMQPTMNGTTSTGTSAPGPANSTGTTSTETSAPGSRRINIGGIDFVYMGAFIQNIKKRKRANDIIVIEKISKNDVQESKFNVTECVICKENFNLGEDSEEKFIRLNCDHIYHHDCIKMWLKEHKTCPLCKSDQ